MKGGVAAILAAVRALAAARRPRPARRASSLVALVPSEEDGGQGTLAAIRAGVTGDLAIITEPSNLDVVVAHAGAITFRLTVPGRAAHASQRREGVSALDKLFVLVRALEADETRRNAAETDPLMTALGLPYPTIIGIVGGRRVGLDRPRPGHRRRPLRRPARPDAGATPRRSCGRHRGRLRRATTFLRDHPATVEITGGRFGSARVPSDHPLPVGLADGRRGVDRPRAGAPRRALRRRHADVRQRRRHAVRHLRPGRRPGRPQRRRARAARRGRGLRPGPRGVGLRELTVAQVSPPVGSPGRR